jgi:AcrR family transcriptional regulator
MHLEAVLHHDAVTAPRQERSQRTLQRILTALGKLLSEKSFDQVSMVELAERAGCAVTCIYARFKDKWSMIAALHESFRDDAIVRIDSFLAPERWRGATADEIIAATTAALVAAYHEHRHLMHAVLLTDDPRVYSRAASVAHHAAERLAQVLPAPAGAATEPFRRRVEFSVRVVLATLQQMVLFDAVPGERAARTNAELARELASLITSYLGDSRRRGSHPNLRTKRRRKEASR